MALYNYTSFSGLLNQGVGDFGKPQTELSLCKNIQEDKIGILKRVPGYSRATTNQVNSTNPVNFLHYYYQPSSNIKYLLAGSNNGTDYTIKYKTTGDWTALTGGTYTTRAGSELSAVNYLNKTFVVGYDAADDVFLAPATINGTTHTTSSATDTDLTGMPSGKFIVRYRDLIYVLNSYFGGTAYRSRAYFCADPVSMALPTTAPAGWLDPIPGSWQWPITVNFIEFGQDDGDEITGGAECADKLVVFTRNSMWTWDENNKKRISDVGCDNHKTIKVIGGVLYWANRDGIWRWDGALPQLISSKVQSLFDPMNNTTLAAMVGVAHNFEYRLFIGSLVIDGNQFTNTWIVFDIRREKFYIRCTYDSATSASKFIDGNGYERIYFGSSTGYVYKQSKYVDNINTDDGNEIDYFFETNLLDFGAPQTVKVSPQINFFTKNAAGLKYIINGVNNGEFNEYRGQIKKNQIEPMDIEVKGYRLKFKFYGKDGNDPLEFEGFTVEMKGSENE